MTALIKYNAARTALAEAHAVDEVRCPNLPGIYAFYRGSQCMYIGESKNIRKRIATHERKRQLDGCEVRFFVCDDRKAIELELIRNLKPIKNGVSVERENLRNGASERLKKHHEALGFDDLFGSIFGDFVSGGAA